jgi:uncharacterized protein (DUF1697 family)
MNTCIALLRGINVGGNTALPMKTLVAILEALDARNVRTYLQSGNAVFESAAKDSALLAKTISEAVLKSQGFAPAVLLLTPAALAKAIADNPFPEAVSDPSHLHLGFLSCPPTNPDLVKLDGSRKESERFVLTDSVFYLHAPEGVGRSKLAAGAEKCLGVPMTDRNWKTVCKLLELAGG